MRIALNRSVKRESGPLIFTRRLFDYLVDKFDVKLVRADQKPDIYFCIITCNKVHGSKIVLRIDGMYWDGKDRNGQRQNPGIFRSIRQADGVVFQSKFCKKSCEYHAGKAKKSTVILNAVDQQQIKCIEKAVLIDKPGIVACSAWRPTKRPNSICRGFLKSDVEHYLYMVGQLPEGRIKDERIIWTGRLSNKSAIGVMKACTHAVHLAKFDPCPNALVEEVSCGLPVLHTDNGGIPEIVKDRGIQLNVDAGWNYSILHSEIDNLDASSVADGFNKLVHLPKYDDAAHLSLDICAKKYYDFFLEILNGKI